MSDPRRRLQRFPPSLALGLIIAVGLLTWSESASASPAIITAISS
jgi:hypothetical protein